MEQLNLLVQMQMEQLEQNIAQASLPEKFLNHLNESRQDKKRNTDTGQEE